MINLPPPCSYRILEGRVHEFVLHEASRRSVDMIFDTSTALLQEDMSKGEPCLIDSQVGVMPLSYVLQRARQMHQAFPQRKPARVAVLTNANTLVHTAMILLRPILPIRLYKPAERELALAWLRDTQHPPAKRA